MEDKEKAGISDRIWNFFASVKLTVVILIILPLISIIGTIVEQQADQATNIKLLTKFFGDSTAPAVYNIFVKLGFMDMYRSWWFLGILILIALTASNITNVLKSIFPEDTVTAVCECSLPVSSSNPVQAKQGRQYEAK